jgi:uncharacterized NAD-dependent epimerase/dehydratase family protein
MSGRLWRVAWRVAYLCGMGPARRNRHVEPERTLPGLDQWAGLWVAVKDGKVIAAASNSRDLVPKVRELGDAGHGAVAQYVPPHTDDIVIGVG